jgi:hypothetical protein
MIGLLHLPLVLVPGLTFLAVALALRAPVSRARLIAGAVVVALGVALAQLGLSRAAAALGIHGVSRGMLLEFAGSLLVQLLAFRVFGGLRVGRALLAALVAAGLDWLVSAIWAAGLGGGRATPL